MSRLDRFSRFFGLRPIAASEGGMPLRHKLMLVLAVEILAMGFRQAEMNRHDKGIVVEAPAHAGNAIV